MEVVQAVNLGGVVAEVESEQRVGLQADDLFVDRHLAVQTELEEAARVVVQIPNEDGARGDIGNGGGAKDEEEFVAVGVVDVPALLFAVFFVPMLFMAVLFAVRVAAFILTRHITQVVAGNEKDRPNLDVVSGGEIPFDQFVAQSESVPHVDREVADPDADLVDVGARRAGFVHAVVDVAALPAGGQRHAPGAVGVRGLDRNPGLLHVDRLGQRGALPGAMNVARAMGGCVETHCHGGT